ncbi:MAG: SDR family oxidoreductase [Nitrospirales bacterium]|nr:SDR family oxidoreductase [Nitrospira sp.]MDR4501764.1 SDR family oxidoreductase [Nitrospirales bacterium]
MKTLIIGATSAIAHETAKLLAHDGADFFLVGRSQEKLQILEQDLLVRGAKHVYGMAVDVCQLDRHQHVIDTAIDRLQGLDSVLIAHGTLGNQTRSEESVKEALQEFTTNCLSVISLLTILGNYFERQKSGCIAVITSVAGDRGRQSNYVYGSAKGAVSLFLQGLRNRLTRHNVHVVTIKPGMVDTPMTEQLEKNLLFADPQVVGKRIYHVLHHPQDVVYVPYYWSIVMKVIQSIPERVFKTLNL